MAESALGDLDRAGTNVSATTGRLARPVTPEVRTVALNISPDLIYQGVVDLKGYRVSSAEDLATLAQVYRAPRFETFRMIYVKGNQVVGHEGMASRLPVVVQLFNSVGGFLAMQYHGRVYVLMDSDRHGFVQMARHELLQHIKKESPDLMTGSPNKPPDTCGTTPKPTTAADSTPPERISDGLTCVKRSLPILPGMPSPTPGSSKRSQRGTPLSSRSLPTPS